VPSFTVLKTQICVTRPQCVKYRRREVNCNPVRDLVGKPEGRDQLQDLDVDERITLQ